MYVYIELRVSMS